MSDGMYDAVDNPQHLISQGEILRLGASKQFPRPESPVPIRF